MPIINASSVAVLHAERDKLRREELERLGWELLSVESDIRRLQERRHVLVQTIKALTGEGE